MNIRFRAWDKTEKKMLYPKDIFDHINTLYEDDDEGNLHLNKIINGSGDREELVLMMSTGIFDKNGKEVFEGDRMRYCLSIENGVEKWETAEGGVTFEQGCFWSGTKKANHGELTETGWKNYKTGNPALMYYQSPNYFEVIGNIYEKY